VLRLIEKNMRARDIVTRKRLENAARIFACSGAGTNAALHLPAMVHEAAIDFELLDVTDIRHEKSPVSATCAPVAALSRKISTRWAPSPWC
jgi:dihydroxyacid dehydratase/phosphogluconate dehydratase